MKNTIIAVTILMITISATSLAKTWYNEDGSVAFTEDVDASIDTSAENEMFEPCKNIYDLAKALMSMRQENIPVHIPMKKAKTSFMKDMVLDAYESSRYSTRKYKENAIEDFANKWSTKCYQNTK